MTTNHATEVAVSLPFAPPTIARAADVRLIRAADDLWRVADAHGRIVGHLQVLAHPLGMRYRARRYHVATGRFRDLGDFWSPDDAVASLRAG